jgi:hypothetical protein
MKAKTTLLRIACSIAVVGGAIWVLMGHQLQVRLAQENGALRQELRQTASLAAENERLSNLVFQSRSTQSLPEPQMRELLRLRGEVGVLRQQSAELDTLREENRQARAAMAKSLEAQSVVPAGAAATADYWPRGSWAYAGYGSPEAALQSSFWAANQGDLKTFMGGITGETLEKVENDFEGKFEGEIAAMTKAEVGRLKSVRVRSREAQADDTVVLTVEFEEENQVVTEKLLMKRIGNEWKLSGDQ